MDYSRSLLFLSGLLFAFAFGKYVCCTQQGIHVIMAHIYAIWNFKCLYIDCHEKLYCKCQCINKRHAKATRCWYLKGCQFSLEPLNSFILLSLSIYFRVFFFYLWVRWIGIYIFILRNYVINKIKCKKVTCLIVWCKYM